MPKIQYLAYHFNKPSGPLDPESYANVRAMTPEGFDEYVSVCASVSWAKFKKDNSFLWKVVCVGGPIALACLIIPGVNVVAIGYLFLSLGAAFSLGLSASTHGKFVRRYKAYLRGVRGQIVRSGSYEDYLSIYPTDRL